MAKSATDGQVDLQQAILNLRQSIQNIVTQTSQGLPFADLKERIAIVATRTQEMQNTVRKSFSETFDSYDGASALEVLLRETLRKAVQQNPDAAAMMLGHDPASGSGSKLALAIDMAGLLEKELEGVDITSTKKDASGVAKTLLTLSKGVTNTVEWMNEAVKNFIESLGSANLDAGQTGDQQEQSFEKGWGFGGHGIQYSGGSWSVSVGPTFGGAQIGFEIRF